MMDKPKIVAIIQARMASSRLPGKVLMDISGRPMLAWVIERVRLSKRIDQVVVATTQDAGDEPIVKFCLENEVACTRGSHHDVLDRFYQAAREHQADVIVRITADCPVIDPQVIDHTLSRFFEEEVDFAANRLPPPWKRTYPIGLDTEVCTFLALERAWIEATAPFEREHVMPYLYDREGRFKVLLVNHDPDFGNMRWTVDTPEDLEVLRKITDHFAGRLDFSWYEILDFIQAHPELTEINATIKAKMTQDVDKNYQ
jgi:spore coat polysaccharide biosynthesis protein SpsF